MTVNLTTLETSYLGGYTHTTPAGVDAHYAGCRRVLLCSLRQALEADILYIATT